MSEEPRTPEEILGPESEGADEAFISRSLAPRLPGESIALQVTSEPGFGALATLSDQDFQDRLEQAARVRQRIQQIQRHAMQKDVDYGVVPNTQKPTILKPGTEVLAKMLEATIVPTVLVNEIVETGIDEEGQPRPPRVEFLTRVDLVGKDGRLLASGYGECNSWEDKYRWRRQAGECPACGRENPVPSKKVPGTYFCPSNKGGCGKDLKGAEADAVRKGSRVIENPNPVALRNTLLKLSIIRAQRDATLRGACASGTFTQDVEDEPETGAPPPQDERPLPEKRPAKPSPAPQPATADDAPLGEPEAEAPPPTNVTVPMLFERLRQAGAQTQGDAKRLLIQVLPGVTNEEITTPNGKLDVSRMSENHLKIAYLKLGQLVAG